MKFIRFDTRSEKYKEEIKLRDKVLRKPLGMKLTPEFLKSDKDDFHFSLIDDTGKMVACLLIKKISDETVKLRQMAVNEDDRGKGLGKFLIEKTEEALKKEGYSKIELHARMYAKKFYLKSGYEPVGEEFYEIGIPHIKMIKSI